jgi:hypothetical protein
LVLSFDSKGIVMRREDLRESTRRAADRAARRRRKKRLGSGEKRNRKRMATVASVYSVGRHERTARQIMGLDPAEIPRPPRPTGKRVWASVLLEPLEVMEDAFADALRRDPDQTRRWVVLVDGDERQLKRVAQMARQYEVEVTVVLDFIHVLEYLWKASYCLHPPGSQEAEQWVAERALRLLQGQASDVAAGMTRSATLRGLAKPEREAIDKCAGYLVKNKRHLRYDECLAGGYPIATGVIEGACRHLVKDRMDLTGARWTLEGAEAVLRLRSLRSSADVDEYWAFHIQMEHHRNHASRYVQTAFLEAA